MQREYDIYHHFQYSGVPRPTDEGWHWWGKLNEGGGVVVVMRGHAGEEERKINIPWVSPNNAYRIFTLFDEEQLGRFTGQELREGALVLTLPTLGQEIIELTPID